ncbi:MAG: Ig-like domain-containing protein [Treponema sp.]|nr:Ig-like domain-containing protein [Treponema sp.]
MKKTTVLSGIFAALAALSMAATVFSACDMGPLKPDRGDGTGLEMGIRGLSFDRSLVVGVAGVSDALRRVELRVSVFPPQHTADLESVIVEVDGLEYVRVVDRAVDAATGEIVVTVAVDSETTMDPVTDNPMTATIRAVYEHDRSVMAEAAMMVIPDWPENRRHVFGEWASGSLTQTQLEGVMGLMPGFAAMRDGAGVPTGDWHFGDGVFFLLGPGGGVSDGEVERGGLHGATGVFDIDPEDPWTLGIPGLSGTPRAMGGDALHIGGLANFNDPDGVPEVERVGHLRTGGTMRVFRLMGLQAPFEISVRYRANGAGTRWVDLRFGNESGVRVEGPVSPGNAAGDGRIVRFVWDYYYDQDGVRRERDRFVPVVFVETIGGMQIYDLEVRYLGEAQPVSGVQIIQGIGVEAGLPVLSIPATGAGRLIARTFPSSANQAVQWSSADDGIATVSPGGIVTGVSVGTVAITATSAEDSGYSASVLVEVRPGPSGTPRVWRFDRAMAADVLNLTDQPENVFNIGTLAGNAGHNAGLITAPPFAAATAARDAGNGLFLVNGAATNRLINTGDSATGDLPNLAGGSLRIGGTSPGQFAQIRDLPAGPARVEIAFSSNAAAARWPTVGLVGGFATQFSGGRSSSATGDLARDFAVVEVPENGVIFLGLSAAIRVFEIRVVPAVD